MRKGRVEAFSDGVMAIILTVMLLEIKVPPVDELNLLKPVVPVFISYVLSFIYWNKSSSHVALCAACKWKSMVVDG